MTTEDACRETVPVCFFFFFLSSQTEQMQRCNRRHYLWAVRSRGFATLASPYGEPQQEDSGYGRGEGNSARGVTGGACGLVCNTHTELLSIPLPQQRFHRHPNAVTGPVSTIHVTQELHVMIHMLRSPTIHTGRTH